MSTVIEETYCDKCGTDLEEGQTGLCGECRPHKFSELSEKAKQHAREEYTSGDYPGYDWWDHTYEDAARMAEILGIKIDENEFKTCGGGTGFEPEIHFSGFCSQGDGACFEGSYSFNLGCVKEISEETNDAELLRIATELYTMQLARRMQGLEYFNATITTSGRYSHSGTMNVEVPLTDDEDDEPDEGFADEVTQLMRDLANWIYEQLKSENDWLYSDEHVDERLNEELFDADGVRI